MYRTPYHSVPLINQKFRKGVGGQRGLPREETLQRPEIQAFFLYPFSYTPLGKWGHLFLENFLGPFWGFVCRQPPPANPFSKPPNKGPIASPLPCSKGVSRVKLPSERYRAMPLYRSYTHTNSFSARHSAHHWHVGLLASQERARRRRRADAALCGRMSLSLKIRQGLIGGENNVATPTTLRCCFAPPSGRNIQDIFSQVLSIFPSLLWKNSTDFERM